jgi:hypothetical protein
MLFSVSAHDVFFFIRGNDLRALSGNVTIVYGVTVDEWHGKCSKQKMLATMLYGEMWRKTMAELIYNLTSYF